MKYYLTLFVLFLFVNFSYGQLKLNKDKPVAADADALTTFLKNNHIEYAVMSWYTSGWSRSDHSFCGLLKQDNVWYMATLKCADKELPQAFNLNMIIKQVKLSDKQVDSTLKVMKPDSAFRHSQIDLLKLPEQITYQKDGQSYSYAISDAGTAHLILFKNNDSDYRTYYAPSQILSAVYPYAPEYGILRGLVNTLNVLSEETYRLKLW